MGWKRWTVGVLLPLVLCVLPLAGGLCTLACDLALPAATTDSAHHHGAPHHERAPGAAGALHADAAAAHACAGHVTVAQPATVQTVRDGVSAPSQPATPAFTTALSRPHVRRVATPHTHPPGTAPPITTALVLRV